ncbi:mannosyltransferase [Microbotryomycetes sp. JL201]|nr:mannosyltransferase [Microbotryomycetes sp. JL201]
MMYHTQSLLDCGLTTSVIAYRGSTPLHTLVTHPSCKFVYLPTPLAVTSRLPRPFFLLLAPLKVALGALSLLWAVLWRLEYTPQYILVQNPPSIPTLPILQFAVSLTGSKLVIDWHNTGYSMLSLRLGRRHPVVRIARSIELAFGRKAYAHFGLVKEFYDRPPPEFRRLDAKEAHEFFSNEKTFASDDGLKHFVDPPAGSTLFTTTTSDGVCVFRPNRPALVVSATSWTADEDFNLLLESLSLYDKAAGSVNTGKGGVPGTQGQNSLPKLVVVVTGKGTLREGFERRVKDLERGWKWVRVRTAWLAIQDYPKLLGSADLGVSLHTSTSGSDLPMKVVDMFGCDLPVCALNFACLHELVKHGQNSLSFETAQDLANSFIDLLRLATTTTTTTGLARPSNKQEQLNETYPLTRKLDDLKRGIRTVKYGQEESGKQQDKAEKTTRWRDWKTNWNDIVRPLFI